ncbi:VIT1/CCC1 transporter family protein, partial [Rhizobium leguminosarum]|uniref:VIT1/CCC1 transporter family protein n=1 Tax=Rhizobium leguminosarum TaxID=384 RepID=UPI003F94CC27
AGRHRHCARDQTSGARHQDLRGSGGYVSVSSQADTEEADLARERTELETQPEAELDELTQIYVKSGLTHDLARQVAVQLTANNVLDAHL